MRIDNNYLENDNYRDYQPRKYKKRKKHNCLKFFIISFISLVIVLAIVYASVKFAIGPTIEKVNGLPNNFPQELVIYQIDQAKIELQSTNSKARLLNLLKAMPNWIINPILDHFSDNLKQKLVDNFGDKIDVTKDFSAEDLKTTLNSIDLQKIETVIMNWKKLPKSKEELLAYYKQKLKEGNFEFKENLEDYEINLGFWKDDIFGTMSFSDTAENTEGKIMVNYLNR